MGSEFQTWCIAIKPIVDAGAEGLSVGYRDHADVWHDKVSGGLGPCAEDYRIKPTPKYRPFTLEEAGVLCGKDVHDNRDIFFVSGIQVMDCGTWHFRMAAGSSNLVALVTPQGAVDGYRTEAGLPCGVREDGDG